MTPAVAHGAAYGVNDTTDTPVGQACPGFTDCSLREAVTSAEANPGADAILVSAGTYPLTNGELDITEELSVGRVGAGTATISGNNASRIFDISGAGADFTLRFVGLTDGSVSGAGSSRGGAIRAAAGTTLAVESSSITGSDVVGTSDARGGAIYSEGVVTIGRAAGSMTNSSITGNSATAIDGLSVAHGGGVATGGAATLTVGTGTSISNNDAIGAAGSEVAGGGAYAANAASFTEATVAGNDVNGGYAYGGGVAAATGTASFIRSTISGNTLVASTGGVTSGGAGVGVPAAGSADISVAFSTVADNLAHAATGSGTPAVAGAGLANLRAGGAISATNSTIAGNSSTRDSGSEARAGGIHSNGGAVTAGATILAENSQADGASQCRAGASLTSSGYSLLGDVSACTYVAGIGDVTGVTDAGLKALGDYGGVNQTMMVERTSPALDVVPVDPPLCVNASTDQRGTSRPQSASCDVGSVEARPATLTVTPSTRTFPSTATGNSSAANMSVSNSGDLDMSAAPSAAVDAPFAYSTGCTAPVAAGSNCIMGLTFSPTATGPFSETLTVTSGSLSDTATLNGTGVAGAPDTAIASGPTAGSSSSDNDPAFTYSADVDPSRSLDRFECRLDSDPFVTCPNAGVAFTDVPDGVHTFEVRAVDSAAETDASPATRTWTIDTVVDPPTPEPEPEPSNEFAFGKLKLNERRGTARLAVEVPGPGELAIEGKGLASAVKPVAREGRASLTVRPLKKLAKKLKRKGKAKVNAEVTYTPTGGAPNTKTKRVGLKRGGRG
jgi:hypothetical protein